MMTKKNTLSFISASLFLLTSPVIANTYMALQLGGGSFKATGTSSDDKPLVATAKEVAKDLDTKVSLRLLGGLYLNDNIRLYAYAQQDGKLEVTKKSIFEDSKYSYEGYELGLGAEYLYHFNDKFHGVLGGTLGHYNSKMIADVKTSSSDFYNNTKQSGLVTSLNLGVGYNMSNQFSLEGGWRLSHYSGNEHKHTYGSESETYDFKRSNEVYLGVGYKF